jgi:hypothetical protein
LYFGRFAVVHIGGPSSNQAASLESQQIQQIQLLFGRTLSAAGRVRVAPGAHVTIRARSAVDVRCRQRSHRSQVEIQFSGPAKRGEEAA